MIPYSTFLHQSHQLLIATFNLNLQKLIDQLLCLQFFLIQAKSKSLTNIQYKLEETLPTQVRSQISNEEEKRRNFIVKI